jgi:hypothetical protein
VAESVRRISADELMSYSERPTRSLNPESFWPELSVPTLDRIDWDLTAKSVATWLDLTIGSKWTVLMLLRP